ncbi:MAG: PqqD family protein [Acidobacteriota bacterium]|nr:PqqD family protein [Acidobacteriota bacterium]
MDPNQINPDSVVCWSSAPVGTEVNDEVILMNMDRDRCYGLGVTGSDIWRRLRTPIRVSELWTQLAEEYAAGPGEIESDVLRTLREFAAEGLIEVHPGGG